MKLRISIKWIVLWSLWAARFVRQPTLEVKVHSGLIRGSVSNDGTYLYYVGIPYASVGKQFQAPAQVPKWQNVFDAVDEHIHCTQRWLAFDIISGQDDCLIINVYKPNNALDSLLPVMVFIHGGGFLSGSSEKFMYGPEYLVPKGVILVTFNYRLSVLGKICLRIKEAPGNAAMKDQVAALRWVQTNIKEFGGDANDVTLFGESAGGASVSYHVLSPISKGLFHKAIIQSGSSLSKWAFQSHPLESGSVIAKNFGYDVKDPYDILNILISKSNRELVRTFVPTKEGVMFLARMNLSPCVEKEIAGEEAFLTQSPYEILSSGNYNKVPMMIGVNSEEGYFFVGLEYTKSLPNINFEESLPYDINFRSQREKQEIANKVRQLYMGHDEISRGTLQKFSKIITDQFFVYPYIRETELLLKSSDEPIYNYLFNYDGWRNMAKLVSIFPLQFASGASHADDLFYLFKQALLPNFFEDKMIHRMTSLWTNFAKYGDPTPDDSLGFKWNRTEIAKLQGLVLGEENPHQENWSTPYLLFWKELYSK